MNKTIVKLVFIAPGVIGALVVASVLAFNAVRHTVINDNEVLVHSVAQNLLPALMANDTEQVEALLKELERHPGIQSAELISAQGVPIASYSRSGQPLDPSNMSFELAGAPDDPNQLHVMAPITFDSLIVANLHIAVNLWPAYLRIMIWLGLLLIVPSVIYVLVRQFRVKLRFEVVGRSGSSGGGDSFDVKKSVSSAMGDADISVEFQPIQRMSDAGLFGMEVVVCWRHPSGQTLHLSPSAFMTLAEGQSICLPFDDWLLTTACAKAAEWQHQYGPLVLALNISAAQFKNPSFASKVRSVCEQTQYPHQLLELEIHESVICDQLNQSVVNFEAFKAQGLSVTVDNFGLLHKSLDLIGAVPMSKVKLDSKLVKRLSSDDLIEHLVQEVVSHAVSNDVQVMVEGVETQEQREVLQSMGCILGQGTYFHPPLSAKAFANFLADRSFDNPSNKLVRSGSASSDLASHSMNLA